MRKTTLTKSLMSVIAMALLATPSAWAQGSDSKSGGSKDGKPEDTIEALLIVTFKRDLELDTATRIVSRAGGRVDLKLKEYSLLEFLMRNAHRPVTRTMIMEHVWDVHFDNVSNVVDVHINSLRNKIDKGFSPALIHTIRGVGYQLTDREP